MKKVFIVILLVVVAVAIALIYFPESTTTLKDAEFTESIHYTCAEGKILTASFAYGIARVALQDERVFTLEQVSVDHESGTKFANDGDQIVFWVRDGSAFLQEDGTTTYSGCRVPSGIVAENPDGEADPNVMKLDMKKWVWISALYNDGREIKPKQVGRFTLTFSKDGTFSATTDCNGVGGKYTATRSQITFSEMMSTLMYCEGSQEQEFNQLLTNTSSYHFTSRGELILDLKFDSGSVVFR